MGLREFLGLDQFEKDAFNKKVEYLTKFLEKARSNETRDLAELIVAIIEILKSEEKGIFD